MKFETIFVFHLIISNHVLSCGGEIYIYIYIYIYLYLYLYLMYLFAISSLVAQMVKRLPAMRETRFDPWVRKIPWRRKW